MDLDEHTTTRLAGTDDELRRQVRTLADKDALRALGALYSIAVDDHDLATVVRCFAPEGSFTFAGTPVVGHPALRAFYTMMMDRYVTTLHVPTSHVFSVDTGAGTARGQVLGHAELAEGPTLLLASFRYDDTYVRTEDRWVFASRVLTFMYNVPFEDMAVSFTDDKRIRLPGTAPASADYPETLPTWSTYHD